MNSRLLLGATAALLTSLCAYQLVAIRSLQRDVKILRAQVQPVPSTTAVEPDEAAESFWAREESAVASGDVSERLARLELAVERWDRAADLFMDRGMLPPSAEKLAEFRATFLNTAASDRERLNALRMLRRNNGVTPEVLAGAAAWLTSTQDAGTLRSLLQGLEGLTDPSLFETTFALATSADRNVQGQAIQNLAAFRDNPRAAELLWKLATTAESREVRGRAGQALTAGGYSPATAAAWQTRALDASAPPEQRALALRVLAEGGADIGPIAASFAESAQATQDKVQFLDWMGLFDSVNNPAFLGAVVRGVQSTDVDIRRRAADTLRDYRNDPTAQQWLQYLAQSDPDERVRNEAARGVNQR